MFRRTLMTWTAPLAILALALVGTGQAQQMPPGAEPPPETEPPPGAEPGPEAEPPTEMPPAEIPGLEDPHPLVTIHAINQIQSQLGLMGVNEAINPEVREFAGDLAERHNELDRSMLETANDLDIDVAGSGEVRMAMEQRLQNLDPQLHMLMEAPPQAFDAAFLALVERSHEDAIEAVEAIEEEVEEQQVRAHLDEALELYRAAGERARDLQAEVDEPEAPAEAPLE